MVDGGSENGVVTGWVSRELGYIQYFLLGDEVFISMENSVRQQRLFRSKGFAVRHGCISRERKK